MIAKRPGARQPSGAFPTLLILLKLNSFFRQQPSFPLQSAAETTDLFVGGKDAMARDEDGNRIGAARAANGAHGFRISDRRGNFTVTFRSARRQLQHFTPDGFLEISRAVPVQRRQRFWIFAGQDL